MAGDAGPPRDLSARGSLSGQFEPRGTSVAKPRETPSHRGGTMILSLKGGLTYTIGHDDDPDRLRPLLHRQAGPRRPESGARKARGRLRADLHRSWTDGHEPVPPRP